MHEQHRQHATIGAARSDLHDKNEDRPTTWVQLRFGDSSGQGFGGYIMKEHHEAFDKEICTFFGVKDIKDLEGRNCYALRSNTNMSAEIVGLENMKGERFIAAEFFRRHTGKTESSKLAQNVDTLYRRANNLTKQVHETLHALEHVADDYVEWDPLYKKSEPGEK